jgi:para-aminobenzoate synthetase component 1
LGTPSTISVCADRTRFDTLAHELAHDPGCDMLLSTDGYPARTESVVGIGPVAELIFTGATDLNEVKRFCFGTPGPALGFVSYDYGMLLRGVASSKPHPFPPGHLKKFATTLEYRDGRTEITGRDPALVGELARRLERIQPGPAPTLPVPPEEPPIFSLDRAGYEAGVAATLRHILAGDTYQLNLSTHFSRPWPNLDPPALFRVFQRRHPAPFYAWLTSGPWRVLSASPERFLRVRDGEVLSQPIKGTLRVEGMATRDAKARLTGSAKESAELSMIVDLIRNDISTHCEYGSVRVEGHQSVFQVDDLLQMYSDVRGRLRPGRDCLDLFFGAFPGGSVTGCPKLRSMEIIEGLEPHARGLFCGACVVVRDERNMDSSIAIRTAVFNVETKVLDGYAGSGIVVDSQPSTEYHETMSKAGKFLFQGRA